MRGGCLLPRNGSNDHGAHEQVEYGDHQHREHNRPGDIPAGILNLCPEISDVVVAAIVIHSDERGARQPIKEGG